VVAVFPSLEGDSLEDFSIRLAETWKVGQKGRDNGVIFLIFKNDQEIKEEDTAVWRYVLNENEFKKYFENKLQYLLNP